MKSHVVMGMLLFSALPVWAAPQPVFGSLVFTPDHPGTFEAGWEKVEGAAGEAAFLRAKAEGDNTHQMAELALELPGAAYHGKRLRFSTRLKVEAAGVAACSLEARGDDKKPLLLADGEYRSGTSGWRDCSVVMQIPGGAASVHLRLVLWGSGEVWSDGFNVEDVGADVPLTQLRNPEFKYAPSGR